MKQNPEQHSLDPSCSLQFPIPNLPTSNSVEPSEKREKLPSSPRFDSFNGPVKSLVKMKPDEVFTTNPLSKPFIGNHTVRKAAAGSCYTIDTISTVKQLVKRVADADAKKRDKIKLRFLVTIDYQLLFAKEGPASTKVPTHYQMTGVSSDDARCLTAGIIIFKRDNMEITKITHKSGDFCPSLDSLQWVLPILFVNGMQFNEQIIIHRQPEAGGELDIEVNVSELKDFITKQFNPKELEAMKNANKDLASKRYEYGKRSRFISFYPPQKKSATPTYDEDAPKVPFDPELQEAVFLRRELFPTYKG